jgi:predicted amidohydrolase
MRRSGDATTDFFGGGDGRRAANVQLLAESFFTSGDRNIGAKTVKVAAVQSPSVLGDVEENCARLTRLVEQAAGEGAKIIVLPEAAISGYVSQDLRTNWHLPNRPLERMFRGRDPLPVAETVPGPSTRQFAALAKRLGVYLTIPFVEQVPQASGEVPRLFNTVCLASPRGEIVAHYRKLMPWPLTEQSWSTPGDRGVQTCDTEYGRVGLAICFDIHTILSKYAEHELWALLFPIAWVDNEHPAEWFWRELPAKIRAAGHHLIGANWSLDEAPPAPWRGYGFSTIIAADGMVLNSAHSLYGEEIVYADLPLST